jgi:mono/diheme cytochrome c family protein
MKTFRPLPVRLLLAGLLAAVLGASISYADDGKTSKSQKKLQERGKYIVTTSGCNDCHTPFKLGPNGPEPDMDLMLSGHPQSMDLPNPPALPDGPWNVVVAGTNTAWSGPWGISYTANLTPDKETGLGKWTYKEFRDTIRTGRHLGRGRLILPPMPIPMYKHFTDDDMKAVFAYLQSIPAISNKVPEPVIPEEVASN